MEKRKNRRGENAGFSLIEVIVAVCILAVITIPVLRALATGSTINGKSREVLNATAIAQNLMEELKAQQLPEDGAQLISQGYAETTNALGELSYVKEQQGISVEGKNYNARIILNPGAYESTYNSQPLAEVGGVNLEQDVVYIQSGDYQRASGLLDYNHVVEELQKKLKDETGITYELADIEHEMVREIQIDISGNSGAMGVGYTNDVTICIYYEVTLGGTTAGLYNPNTASIYKSVEAVEELRNVYLIYEPLYEGKGDTIKINNLDEVPVDVYLIKQTGTDGEEQEAAYRVKVQVEEGATGGGNWQTEDTYRAATKIRTNLDYSVRDASNGVKLSTPQASYSYKKGGVYNSDTAKMAKVLSVSEPAGTEAEGDCYYLYGVSVEVYSDKGQPVGEKYGETYKLVTLDGSRLN